MNPLVYRRHLEEYIESVGIARTCALAYFGLRPESGHYDREFAVDVSTRAIVEELTSQILECDRMDSEGVLDIPHEVMREFSGRIDPLASAFIRSFGGHPED